MSNLRHRCGLLPQVLLPLSLVALLCIVAVQVWTLRFSQQALEQRIERNLSASVALLKAYLAPFGHQWSLQDGQLTLGTTLAANQDEVLDQAAQASGGVATLFSGDQRVATNIRLPDGQRAVGTRLTDPAVRDTVLRLGQTFRGKTTILGRDYLTIYEPVRDAADRVIGIMFTGIPAAELDEAKATVLHQAVLGGAVVTLAFALIGTLLLVRALRPLNQLTEVTRRLTTGALDLSVPSTERNDQIGAMARAVALFRQASLDKMALEAEAAALRRLSDAERHARAVTDQRAAEAQGTVLRALAGGLSSLSQGDLTVRLSHGFSPEYEPLAAAQLQRRSDAA